MKKPTQSDGASTNVYLVRLKAHLAQIEEAKVSVRQKPLADNIPFEHPLIVSTAYAMLWAVIFLYPLLLAANQD